MGWTGTEELDHLNNVLNDRLADLKATDAEVIGPSLERLLNETSAHQAEPARCWYVAPGPDGKPYLGVVLIDIDTVLTPELKRMPGQVYVRNRDEYASHSDPHVQVWLTSEVSLDAGPNHRDYPERFSPYATDNPLSGSPATRSS